MGKAHITVLEGGMLGKAFKLTEGIQTIGRGEDVADVVIPDKSISKIHATLDFRDNTLYIIDKDSTNGIFHNREKVRQATVLDQQFFSIGDILFRFESGAEAAEIIKDFQMKISSVLDELGRKIVGREEVLKQLLCCFFTGGHCILTGVAGLEKDTIVSYISEVFGLNIKQIHFTPDLMPTDIIGATVTSEEKDEEKLVKFVKGPIFTQLLLASELRHTPPKTQMALLEVMREGQVVANDEVHKLPRPFMVIATQNPDTAKDVPLLSEALCEQFMFDITIDYPSLKEEEEGLRRANLKQNWALKKIISQKEIMLFKNTIKQIEVSAYIISYVCRLVRSTRLAGEGCDADISSLLCRAAGPSTGEDLISGAKAFAAVDGRLHVNCEDIRQIVFPVLRHRISPSTEALTKGLSSDDIIVKILEKIKEPEMPKFT